MIFDTDDVTSSQGVFPSIFNDIIVGSANEDCDIDSPGLAGDPVGFHVGGINVRRVEPRNTPTVINAALNFRNFWDGRANNIFNGNDPFGRRNQDARILRKKLDDSVEQIKVEFENSSLASQSVGPPGSPFEMSCAGRTFPKIGKKLLSLNPSDGQAVDPTDSVLGPLALILGGLNTSYEQMIEDAFANNLWDSNKLFDIAGNEIGMGAPANTDQFTMKEHNFALFWGLAIQLYQATLISDQAPFDTGSMTAQQDDGFNVFLNQGKCVNCHDTAMFTKASTLHLIAENQEEGLVERMLMGQDHNAYQLDGTVNANKKKYTFKSMLRFGPFTSSDVDSLPQGKLTVTEKTKGLKKLKCDYSPNSATQNPDGNPSTIDVKFDFTAMTSDPGCGNNAYAIITINPKKGKKEKHSIKFIRDGVVLVDDEVAGKLKLKSLVALYDNGFYNIGVRPTKEDKGVGGKDPFGNPLSLTRQYLDLLLGNNVPDPFQIDECTFEIRFNPAIEIAFFPGGFDSVACDDGSTTFKPTNNAANQKAIAKQRVAVDGAFKVATLRNTELSGPFFHNGGQATLKQVVAFYNRGADFAKKNKKNLDPDIQPLGLSDQQQMDLVDFLKALTDDRVRCEQVPFDHPELPIPNGHPGDQNGVTESAILGQATDDFTVIAATGALAE